MVRTMAIAWKRSRLLDIVLVEHRGNSGRTPLGYSLNWDISQHAASPKKSNPLPLFLWAICHRSKNNWTRS